MIFGFFADELQRSQKQVRESRAESVLNLVDQEIKFAKGKETGFSRFFLLPALVNDYNYTLIMEDHSLVINTSGGEYVKLLGADVNGSINIWDSLNASMRELRVTKLASEVIVEHCANCGALFDDCMAQHEIGVCDPADFREMCQELHGLCI